MPELNELEGKFSCQREDLEHVLKLDEIGTFQLTCRDERIQTDVYYDTATLELRGQSCSLRTRTVGGKHKATFKGPRQAVDAAEDVSHLIQRLEIEVEIDPCLQSATAFVDRLDIEPVRRAREMIAPGRELNPIARLITNRRMLHYERRDGEVVELSLDDVQALDLRDNRRTHIVEVELELIEGTAKTLVSAANSLRYAVPMLRPSMDSKLAQTLGEVSRATSRS